MCLAFFYINPDPRKGTFSLILVFNRDEFLNRSTAPASWQNGILAGRDLAAKKEGGTWLAISKSGKLGFLTNLYTGVAVQGEGRGFLITDYLASSDSPGSYLTELATTDRDFSPFNLCLMEPDMNLRKFSAAWYSRSRPDNAVSSEGPSKIQPGCYGLGNHPMSTPFQKTANGRTEFEKIVSRQNRIENQSDLEKSLFDLMCTKGYNLPDAQMEIQGSKSAFRSFHDKLSSIFVDMPQQGYGTRK